MSSIITENAQRSFPKEMETTLVTIVTKGRKSNQQRYLEIKKVETSSRLLAASVKITLNICNTLRDDHSPRAIDGTILWFYFLKVSPAHSTSLHRRDTSENKMHIPFEHQGRVSIGPKDCF